MTRSPERGSQTAQRELGHRSRRSGRTVGVFVWIKVISDGEGSTLTFK
jgi:hypothetical protein